MLIIHRSMPLFDLTLVAEKGGGISFDVEAMHTAQGKHTIDGIMARLPRIPWEVDVDDHVCQLNSFFQGQLAVHFAAKRQRPRHPALSDRTWKLLSTKRHLRRSQRFRFAAVSKRRLSELFVAWKGCCWAGPALNFDHMHARLKADDLQASLFVFAMRRLQVQIRASFREDIAVFTRAMWKDARGGGPAEMARLLRSVLKAGRSYKPPRAAVALNCNGHTVTDPKDVATTFGRMFAVAEQAREVDFSELQGCPGAAVSERPTCMVEHLPSVATVAASFASLKPRRAAGLSRIPPDFYAAAPLRSALAHIPVLLKMLARRRAPVLWGGCLSRPLLKPHKAPDDPKSYRAIALQEPAAKAVSKALRPHLCDCFEQVALQGIGGARPAFALTVPALTVQASLSFAREAKRSIGVLFIDGVAAFYATSREALFRQDRAELEHRLRSGPHAGEVVEAFLSYLPSEGALAAAGVDTAAVDFLQVAMSNTWYSTFPSAPEVYQTSKGTIPGAPLADILFQYVLQAAVLTLDFLLRRSGLALSVQHGGHSVHAQPCSWLDDLTLLVQADDPASLADAVSQAAILAHRCLSLIGIEVNYAPNKTEALLQWRGKGSQAAKERVLVNNAGLIDLGEISGTRLQLRCTDEYTHLGSVRASSATASADLSRRAALARTLYQPLRARLLRNVELSVKERSHLLFSTVIASFTHGLGTWTLARHGEWKQFRGEYMKFLRGAVRPILAVPCRRLDASQVCALLGALTPEEAFVVCRVRAFSQLVAKGSDFVKSVLVLERTWLSSVREAILQLQAALRLTALAAFKELPLHGFWEVWPYDSKATSRLLKNYSKVRIRSREGLFQPALAKAQLHHKLDSLECTFIKLGPVEAGARQVACAECGQIFSTPASCAAHRRAVHDQRALASYGFGTACQVCCRQFWTPAKLRDHLRRAHHCATVYSHSDIAEDTTSGPEPLCRSMPAVDLVGPRPWWATLHPRPGKVDPPVPICALDCQATFDRFRSSTDLHAFFNQRARAVELQHDEGLQLYFEAQTDGSPIWQLANAVAAALGRDETGVLVQPPLSAIVRHDFLIFGPSATIEIVSGWDLSLL